ncbi:SpoIIAA family protein [Botryobacter ruber]|uniref:STAS/SEC14 domain-containing protein n=1 Tax=Botryobacter ruber TaxID=2171629 RepID=UPI000E0C3729|nr:STAS/SEC14 domain-containing protein [Botryobacter ruber]
MLHILDESRENVIAVRINGHVDKGDYDMILPIMEEKIKTYGKINVFVEIMDSMDFTAKALWEELKFDVKHARDFNKVAIVGDGKWIDALSVAATPFTSAKIKKFGRGQRQEAFNWVRAEA